MSEASSPNIVSFDNEIIKNGQSPAALLPTFAAGGKSRSVASEARAEKANKNTLSDEMIKNWFCPVFSLRVLKQ